MNAISFNFDFEVDPDAIEDVIMCHLLHPFNIRSIDKNDIFCPAKIKPTQFIYCRRPDLDFSYTYVDSDALLVHLRSKIKPFIEALSSRSAETGKIIMKFLMTKNGDWPFMKEDIVYEVITYNIKVIHPKTEAEKHEAREKLWQAMFKCIEDVRAGAFEIKFNLDVSSGDYLNYFDMNFGEWFPQLHKIEYVLDEKVDGNSLSTTFKKLLRNTLTFG